MFARLEFDSEKAAEAILFVAERLDSPTFFYIAKALYFADLVHLEKYGRPIIGDQYIAMRNGPVPSAVYDMLKHVRDNSNTKLSLAANNAFEIKNQCHLIPLRKANENLLSKSDVYALEAGVKRCYGKTFKQLSKESHDAAWESANENDVISIDAVADMLSNSEEIKAFLNNPIPD